LLQRPVAPHWSLSREFEGGLPLWGDVPMPVCPRQDTQAAPFTYPTLQRTIMIARIGDLDGRAGTPPWRGCPVPLLSTPGEIMLPVGATDGDRKDAASRADSNAGG
jgi:hypothetical protein